MKPLSANTESRQAILDRIRTREVPSPELPEIKPEEVTTFEDPSVQFRESLEFVGGQVHYVKTPAEIEPILKKIDVYKSAKRVVSLVPVAVDSTVQIDDVHDPHDLATLDWTIARGEFMVAENGAIWIDGATLPHRVLLFIAQYMAIVVPKNQIVSNMHQAYGRLKGFDDRFGVFVSGPSKTADIEQSLVLGAHGCRKLQVFVVG